MATWRSQGASACSTLPGVSGQYQQPVSAKAQIRSPKSESRKKAETRNPKCPSVASAFGIRPSFGFRPSEFGFGRLAAGGTPGAATRAFRFSSHNIGLDTVVFVPILLRVSSFRAERELLRVLCFCSCLLYTSPSPRDGLLSRM